MLSITALLVAAMLISGSANSLLTKFQDKQCVSGCDDPRTTKTFDQPVFQTLQMFIAEFLCWIYVIYTTRAAKQQMDSSENEQLVAEEQTSANETQNSKNTLSLIGIFGVPAFCDICATTLMNMGLILTPVSVYQMTRGAVVLFVGFFSTVFLKAKISRQQWWGLINVFCGVFIVGLSSWLYSEDAKSSDQVQKNNGGLVVFGMFLIFIAQLLTASQFVVEEYFMEKYRVLPIRIVALEGTFGTGVITVSSILITLCMSIFAGKDADNNEVYRVFDLGTSLRQVTSSISLVVSSIAIMTAIAVFNICGITITQRISATTRSTVDTCRTLTIWAASLLIGWESFNFLQLVGFSLLVYGTLLFNKLIGRHELIEHIEA